MSLFGKKEIHPAGCLILVSVCDTVSECYGAIVTFDNEKSAVRAFRDMVRNKSSLIGQHPSDFHLIRVGFFNPKTGELFSAQKNGKPDVIISGFDADCANQYEGLENVNEKVESNEVLHKVSAPEK